MAIIRHITPQGWVIDFEVRIKASFWPTQGGVYVFCRQTGANEFKALYVGQTENFQQRMATHERWDDALRRGATHVLAAAYERSGDRNVIESALIGQLQPPMNTVGLRI